MKIIALSGSLRSGSFNTAILETIKDRIPEGIDFEIADYAEIPLYNGDIDGDEKPDAVNKLNEQLRNADALVIATPEYNYSVPGVLKNALDWVSRPAFNSVLKDLPVAIISSSMAFTGGVRAQQHLKTILSGTLSRVLPIPEVVIASAHTIIQDGRVTDETTLKFLDGLIQSVKKEIA